jgi:hypothetical protein
VAAAACALLGCSEPEKDDATWTFHTGVRVIESKDCEAPTAEMPSIAVQRASNSYIVTVRDAFSCSGLASPWVNLPRHKKASLVISPRTTWLGGGRSCECPQALKVEITNRLEPGDTLYVVNDSQVVGHVVLP